MRFRSILVYVLLTAWTATPALACPADAQHVKSRDGVLLSMD